MKVTVIGAGAMGGALAKGLLKSGSVAAADLWVSDPASASLQYFADAGCTTTHDNAAAAQRADIVFLVVKPWLVEQVIGGMRQSLREGQTLVVVAAGVSGAQVCQWLEGGQMGSPRVLLAIPNIAIAELCSMTFVVPIVSDEASTAAVMALFNATGSAIIVEEKLLPAGTTLASCGLAYALRYIRAAAEGGVELGFRAADATHIVAQTVKGAVSLLDATHAHPEQLIDQVTTPGGVTIRGLNEMEHAGFTSAVIRGLKAGLGK